MNAEYVITGLGMVCALGVGCDEAWKAMQAGVCGIRPFGRFATDAFSIRIAGTVPDRPVFAGVADRIVAYAVEAAREAVAQASFPEHYRAERIAVVMGASVGAQESGVERIAVSVAQACGARGPRLIVSTACCSSTNALGLARDLLQMDMADAVIAGGADELSLELFAGFYSLGVMSPEPCAPFSQPTGMSLGEGAGVAVVERSPEAERRGAKPLAAILGYGLSSDASHPTSPDPRGDGIARGIESALKDARISPAAIQYVNVHGTGTNANDPAEYHAIHRLFGDNPPPVSASKSFLGHAQGAAGILETASVLLAMQHGCIPPTMNFKGPRMHAPADPVAQATPRPAVVDAFLKTNSAFGGANASIVLARPGSPFAPLERDEPGRRTVYLLGAAALGPGGFAHPDFQAPADETFSARLDSALPKPERLVRGLDPRGLDRLEALLLSSCALALEKARLKLTSSLKTETGLFVGATGISPSSGEQYLSSIKERGPASASAHAFAKMVLNAAAGAASRALSIKGPLSVVSAGHCSGFLALVYACHWLATRGDARVVLAAGADERFAALPKIVDAAGCLVLSSDASLARPDGPLLSVAGWGGAGADEPLLAVAQALERAKLTRADLDAVIRHPENLDLGEGLDSRAIGRLRSSFPPGEARASGSLWRCMDAVSLLESGRARRVLVVEQAADLISLAVILGRAEGTKPCRN
ncbi:MAG: hypothetical protein C4523_18230 [Myxococcales bacterium]|nr:MAG: hypothetical protein C4523_18230 [Myxococcales bacterium]